MTAAKVADQLSQWIGARRSSDNWSRPDVCRLTDDQAMRLCFEVGSSQFEDRETRALAMDAYRANRPWDFISSYRLIDAELAPLVRRGAEAQP